MTESGFSSGDEQRSKEFSRSANLSTIAAARAIAAESMASTTWRSRSKRAGRRTARPPSIVVRQRKIFDQGLFGFRKGGGDLIGVVIQRLGDTTSHLIVREIHASASSSFLPAPKSLQQCVLKNRKLVGIVAGFVQKALNQARRHVNFTRCSGLSIACSRWSLVSRGIRYWPRLSASGSPGEPAQSPRKSERIVSTT